MPDHMFSGRCGNSRTTLWGSLSPSPSQNYSRDSKMGFGEFCRSVDFGLGLVLTQAFEASSRLGSARLCNLG